MPVATTCASQCPATACCPNQSYDFQVCHSDVWWLCMVRVSEGRRAHAWLCFSVLANPGLSLGAGTGGCLLLHVSMDIVSSQSETLPPWTCRRERRVRNIRTRPTKAMQDMGRVRPAPASLMSLPILRLVGNRCGFPLHLTPQLVSWRWCPAASSRAETDGRCVAHAKTKPSR